MSKHLTDDQLRKSWQDFDRPADGSHYRHYKGGLYEIVATGFLEDGEEPCVIYRSLEKNSVWVRPANNFLEDVEYKGQKVPRFTKIN